MHYTMIPVTQASYTEADLSYSCPFPPYCNAFDVVGSTVAMLDTSRLSFLSALIHDIPRFDTDSTQWDVSFIFSFAAPFTNRT